MCRASSAQCYAAIQRRAITHDASLAIEVIKAHIAQKKSELALVNERAKTEL